MNEHTELPEYVSSFSKLAGLLDIGRGQLYEVRNRDRRFPKREKRGWPVIKIGLLLEARRLERMRDADYNAERHESAADMLDKLEAEGERDERMLQLLSEIASGARDIGPDGRSARTLMIEELLNDIASS